MGADLYIEKMDRQKQYLGFEVSDKAIEAGYFRDCYNSSGLFAVMSTTLNKTISWWQMASEIGLDEETSVLPFEQVEEWKELIVPLLEKFKQHKILYYNDYDSKAKKKLNKTDTKEYHAWADKLIRFINLAIEKESGIIWSV